MFGTPCNKVLSTTLKAMKMPSNLSTMNFCNSCDVGKIHSINFHSVEIKITAPFQLIHIDVWGPSSTPSIDGFKYYVHFVDDFSRFTWIFPMSAKSEVSSIFKKFLTFIERQFCTKLKAV